MKLTQTKKPIKLILLGDSGMGKTYGLASLAQEGYKLRIADVDRQGAEVLFPLLTEAEKELVSVMEYNAYSQTADKEFARFLLHIGNPSLESKAQDKKPLDPALYGWKDSSEDHGLVDSWGPESVLVVDTFSFLTTLAKRAMLIAAKKDPDSANFDQTIYGIMGNEIRSKVLDRLASLNCHVILNMHLRYMEDENGIKKFLPWSEGRIIPENISKHFNNIWQIAADDKGNRQILTSSDKKNNRKCPYPNVAPVENTTLGKLFKRIESL